MRDLYEALRQFREEQLPKNIEMMAVEFLTKNPNPNDDAVHDWAESIGVEAHDLEPVFYGLATKYAHFLAAGKAWEKGVKPEDVDKTQLAKGVKVEMEHTTDPMIASRIALDHLAEISDYYTRLAEMEKAAGIKD